MIGNEISLMQNCAVFSCLGMGDGLISLVLSNNLHLNGKRVTTFHPFLGALQQWFPHLPISSFPSTEELSLILDPFDHFYIFFEKSPWMQQILEHCQRHYPKKVTILNPIASPKRDYPHWEGGRFDGNRSFVENLYLFCSDVLKFTVVTKLSGIVAPMHLSPKRFKERLVIHPTSSREGKNWPKEKYLALAEKLKAVGYTPVFILTEEERVLWNAQGFEAPSFASLSDMASYIYESGRMIGNDSGIGHLASALGLETITICRSQQAAKFWRPSWTPGTVITPSKWVPNIKGLRLRDKHWKKWISVKRVSRVLLEMKHKPPIFGR